MRRIAVFGATVLVAFLAFTPLAAAAVGNLDQSQTNTSENGWLWDHEYIHAQTFTAGLSGTLTAVSLYIDVEGADGTIPQPGTDLTVTIFATDSDAEPSGSALATEIVRAPSSGAWSEIDFTNPTTVAAGTMYAITAEADTGLYINWVTDCAENYAAGRALVYDQHHSPTVWQTLPAWSTANGGEVCGRDHAFRTYVLTGAVTPAPTAAPTGTPNQSLEGQTDPAATPPPTSTGGNGSSNESGPMFAMLLCLTAAGLGLAAATAQRSKTHR